MLLFKKLRLFTNIIKILDIKYYINSHVYIRDTRIIKIAIFLIPLN